MKLEWNIFIEDPNKREIVVKNIVPWIWEDLKKWKSEVKKREKKYIQENGHTDGKFDYDTFEWFKEELRKRLQWQFWSRCEYEIVLTDVFGSIKREELERLVEEYNKDKTKYRYNVNLDVERKIDVYEQIMLNFDIFAKYMWDNLCFVRGEYKNG